MIQKDKNGMPLPTPIRSTIPNNIIYTKEQRDMFGTALLEDAERLEGFDVWLGFAEDYHYSGVLKYFGLTLSEWASLPVRRAKEILDLAKHYSKLEYKIQAKAEEETQKEAKKLKKY